MNKPLNGAVFVENNFPLVLDDKGKLFPQYSAPLVSYYDTVRSCKPTQVSIFAALNLIHSGKLQDKIELLRKTANKADRDKQKQLLPSITVSGIFNGGHAEKNLIKRSGLISIDFDNVPGPEQLKKALCNDEYTFCSFISPSGTGVKAIVKIPIDRHTESFIKLKKYYLENYHLPIDEKCKDVSRLMFLSSDRKIFLNENSMQFNSTITDVENIIAQIEAKKIDITNGYDNWLKIGFAFADEFKEAGRELFHRVSGIYGKYDNGKADIQFNECLKNRKNGTTIKTFFGIAKGYGLNISSKKIKAATTPLTTLSTTLPITPPETPAIIQPPANETSKFFQVEKYLRENFVFSYNEVSNDIKYRGKNDKTFAELNENDIYRYLRLQNISVSQSDLLAILRSGFVPKHNPFIQYFEGLPKWYGQTDHILNLCSFIDAKDQERFNRHFKKALIRCVACSLGRSFNKQAFILIGGQSSGKSTFIRWLCPSDLKEYIAENISTDKDSLISLCENFIINLDELAGLQRVELTALKSMISKDAVKIRRPYDKKQTKNIRRANFFGSTNKDEFLTDETGSVRWLCFEIIKIIYDYKKEIDINLVWAQAYNLFKEGFEYELTTTEINENEIANSIHQITTPEMELIQKHFKPAPKGGEGAEALTATDILQKLSAETILKLNPQSIGKALVRLDFKGVKERTGEEKTPKKVYWCMFRD